MKMTFWFSTVLTAALSISVLGCGNEDEGDDDDNDKPKSTDPEGDGGAGDDTDPAPNRSECDEALTCAGNLDNPEDCIANFELGTTQAGFLGTYNNVGFYGYNDKTSGATMIPKPNNYDSEDAAKKKNCDSTDDWVLHFAGEGFAEWGAGIGMDWGGPLNPNCETEEALECLEIGYADPNFLIADAEKDARCQDESGEVDSVKMRCLIHGKNLKEMRDLTEYKGIGFWVMRINKDATPQFQVNFGIPETTRFLADPYLAEEYQMDYTTYEGGCSDDIGDESKKCFNDFSKTIRLPSDLNKWMYQEVLFANLVTASWGLQLPFTSFPVTRSIGIKVQVAQNATFDFYFDDFRLMK